MSKAGEILPNQGYLSKRITYLLGIDFGMGKLTFVCLWYNILKCHFEAVPTPYQRDAQILASDNLIVIVLA